MFTNKVYQLCRKIPPGKISTYKEVADSLNSKAYRTVGNALNKNPHSPRVPCHRVIRSTGEIGGFVSGTKNKIKLLKKEGIKIKNNRVENFEKPLFRF